MTARGTGTAALAYTSRREPSGSGQACCSSRASVSPARGETPPFMRMRQCGPGAAEAGATRPRHLILLAAVRSVSIPVMFRPRLLCVAVAAVVLSSAAAGLGAVRSGQAVAASALDLHKVEWSGVTLPGSVCGASRPIRLHHGSAFFTPVPRRFSRDSFAGKRGVTVDSGWDRVVFGDLAGSGHDDAGLIVDCNNGGGTADGALLYAWVIFSGVGGRLSVVGIVTPQVQPSDELPTLIEIAIEPGKLTAREFFYGPADGTCCASGRARTIWTYAHGALRPCVPMITRRPNTTPGVALIGNVLPPGKPTEDARAVTAVAFEKRRQM